jgi:hypothetical protein
MTNRGKLRNPSLLLIKIDTWATVTKGAEGPIAIQLGGDMGYGDKGGRRANTYSIR